MKKRHKKARENSKLEARKQSYVATALPCH
jgi:hypothetical protein